MLSNIFSSIINASPKIKKTIWKKVYQFLAAKYQTSDWTFMNYGYQDLDHSKSVELKEEDELNRYFIQLYHLVANAVPLKNLNVIEVGSGRGGGADYIKRYFKPSKMTGVDYSQNAIDFCKKTFNTPDLEFVLGDAESLPFGPEEFDVVVNLESSHCYSDINKFISEVTRILKPGGYFTMADFRSKEKLSVLEEALLGTGLKLIKKTNISPQVFHALDEFNDEKMKRFSKMFGTWLKKPLSEFAGMKGSAMHTDLNNGETLYCHYLLQKS